MIWLLAACLLSFGFGQLWKWSQHRGLSAPAVVSTNYLVMATVLMLYFLWRDTLSFSPPILLVGGTIGLSFIVSMLFMTRALERANVGIVLTSFRLSILIPIAYGIWVWDETATALQLLGIALALVSLVLMTGGQTAGGAPTDRASLPLILTVFALQGICHCCLRWVHYADLDPQRLHVLCITALTAGLSGALFLFASGRKPTSRDLTMGLGIGLFNLVALGTTLTALSLFQGTLFFPLNGSAVVILDNVFAHYIWREALSRQSLYGVALGVVAMLLIFQ